MYSNMKSTCLICLEEVFKSKMFTVVGCEHRFCHSCIKRHVEAKLLQERLPKCPWEGCSTDLNFETCRMLFNPALFHTWSQCFIKASIPAKDRTYCPNPKCSALTRRSRIEGATTCVKCRCLFCAKCGVLWHRGMTCMAYKKLHPFACDEDAKLDSLAKEKMWRQCVMCKSMIELAQGCNHISCRCGYEFYYKCGAEWKGKRTTCKCPFWDERNILYNRR